MQKIMNYIGGEWVEPQGTEFFEVVNPATGELLARTPLCGKAEVEAAARAASEALPAWRRTPAQERIQYLFKLKTLLEANLDEIGRTITHGKRQDARRSHRRNAAGHRERRSGLRHPDDGEGRDRRRYRIRPGRDAAAPAGRRLRQHCTFQLPRHDRFLVSALRAGLRQYLPDQTVRESTPDHATDVLRLIEQLGLPNGVINLVNGAKAAVDGILEHTAIRAVTFVGATATARYIYRRAAEAGKRVQAQGGAKNPVVILPDADMEMAVKITADSAFGCAGQRCLATSLAVTVGEARNAFVEGICDAAAEPEGGLWPGRGGADGAGHQPGQPETH
jgi:malonate-semialdehyde dehydrogenase (acetylating)/methylmalonate-semialdehyde dehydrogenase